MSYWAIIRTNEKAEKQTVEFCFRSGAVWLITAQHPAGLWKRRIKLRNFGPLNVRSGAIFGKLRPRNALFSELGAPEQRSGAFRLTLTTGYKLVAVLHLFATIVYYCGCVCVCSFI